MHLDDKKPVWQQIAEDLEALMSKPTIKQIKVADALGCELSQDSPAPVAAVILKNFLSDVLFESTGTSVAIPAALRDIEKEMGVEQPSILWTETQQEVSAWFATRYMQMTAEGLRRNRPEEGDLVTCATWDDNDVRVISSIRRSDGRVFMKGRPIRSAWPNRLEVVMRRQEDGYQECVKSVDSRLKNQSAPSRSFNLESLRKLEEFRIEATMPSREAVRGLEELLSHESKEEPFQSLLTQFPQLLAPLVVGHWRTYVIPKQRLGSEHVTDFLVLGLSSMGPQWVAVELEAPRHRILNKDESLSGPTRHAVNQIQDWREWLTANIAYARNELGLHEITNGLRGLVVIGRSDPVTVRAAFRNRVEEESDIAIHSWDWFLREAGASLRTPFNVSTFACDGEIDLQSLLDEVD